MTASNADTLWIETGGTSSVRRYQIDFKEELAEFFDEKTQGEAFLRIEFLGTQFDQQKLLQKRDQDHYIPQWRLYLPTDFPAYDRQYYPNTVVKFEKTVRNGDRWYQMDMTDVDSAEHDQWRNDARSSGVFDSTDPVIQSQSREYGYY